MDLNKHWGKTATVTIPYDGTTYDLPLPCTANWGGTQVKITTSPSVPTDLSQQALTYFSGVCDMSVVPKPTSSTSLSESLPTTIPSSIQATSSSSTSISAATGTLEQNSSTHTMTAPQSPSSASTPANSTAVTLSSVPTSAFLTGSESPIQNGSSSTSLPSTLISGIRPSNRASSPVATSNATASPDGADASASSPRHKSTAAIAGGIVGGLLGLLLLLGSLLWLRRRQRRLRVPPSAEFMGVVGAFSPEPLRATPRFKLARDSSYEPGEPPPPFIPSAYSDQFFEKEKGAGGEEERSEGEDDAEGYMDGSMDETLHDTSSHDEKIVGEAL